MPGGWRGDLDHEKEAAGIRRKVRRRDCELGRRMQRWQRLLLDADDDEPVASTQNNDGTLPQKLRPVSWCPERFLDRRSVGEKGRPLAKVGCDVLVVAYVGRVR